MGTTTAMLAEVIGNVRPDTFLTHWREIRDAKDGSHDAAMAVTRAKKAAKRDGVDLDVLGIMEKLVDMETDERMLFLRRMVIYFQWIDLPLGAFAEGMAAPEPKSKSRDDFIVWQAGQDGLAAGHAGHQRETNPHPAGSPQYVAWDKKWRSGFTTNQKKIADKMARNAQAGKARGNGNGDGAGMPAH